MLLFLYPNKYKYRLLHKDINVEIKNEEIIRYLDYFSFQCAIN